MSSTYRIAFFRIFINVVFAIVLLGCSREANTLHDEINQEPKEEEVMQEAITSEAPEEETLEPTMPEVSEIYSARIVTQDDRPILMRTEPTESESGFEALPEGPWFEILWYTDWREEHAGKNDRWYLLEYSGSSGWVHGGDLEFRNEDKIVRVKVDNEAPISDGMCFLDGNIINDFIAELVNTGEGGCGSPLYGISLPETTELTGFFEIRSENLVLYGFNEYPEIITVEAENEDGQSFKREFEVLKDSSSSSAEYGRAFYRTETDDHHVLDYPIIKIGFNQSPAYKPGPWTVHVSSDEDETFTTSVEFSTKPVFPEISDSRFPSPFQSAGRKGSFPRGAEIYFFGSNVPPTTDIEVVLFCKSLSRPTQDVSRFATDNLVPLRKTVIRSDENGHFYTRIGIGEELVDKGIYFVYYRISDMKDRFDICRYRSFEVY